MSLGSLPPLLAGDEGVIRLAGSSTALLAVPDADGGTGVPPLTQKLRTRVGVVFPATVRGTRLELWDRAAYTAYNEGALARFPDLADSVGDTT